MSCHMFPGQRTQFERLPNGVVICQSVFSRTLDIDSNEIPPWELQWTKQVLWIETERNNTYWKPVIQTSRYIVVNAFDTVLYPNVKVKGWYKYSHTVTKYNRKPPPLLPLKSGTTILSSFSAKVEDIPRMMSSIVESTGSY